MALVPMEEIIGPACVAGAGVAAFNIIGIEHAEAIVAGAEAARAPVILQVSENCVRYHGALAPIGQAVLAIAGMAAIPAAVHLDHATSEDLVRDAVQLGVGAVMYDASQRAYSANVAATADITTWCHHRAVWVEAELGEIGGEDGGHKPGTRTQPGEAAPSAARHPGHAPAGARGDAPSPAAPPPAA